MKNKKGFLLAEETLKIVIAVICIGFLVYFLVSLWMTNQDSKDLELAKASLQYLVEEINSQDTGIREVEIYNPETSMLTHWGLFIWPYEGDLIKPKTCENLGWEKCICICGITLGALNKQAISDRCDELGRCLEFNSNLEINNPSWLNTDYVIELKNMPLNLKINYATNKIIK